MTMLTNTPITPVAGDMDRRWMTDDYFDLIVWYEINEQLHGFQLCYDKAHRERALTWTHEGGFTHTAVDSGDSHPTANRTPVLVADNTFPAAQVRDEFAARSVLLPQDLREFLLSRMAEYSPQPAA